MAGSLHPSCLSPVEALLMHEEQPLADEPANRLRQIYAGLPRAQQILISTLSDTFQQGFYRQILIEALEVLNFADLLDALQKGQRLTVSMLAKPEYRGPLGLGQSDRPAASNRVYQEIGRAIVLFRDRVSEDPDVREYLDFLGNADYARAQPASVSERFHRLAAAWREDRGPTSSLTEMAMRPEYQQIIGMGRDAVPLLLQELRKRPDHWFWALVAITGEDPVPPEHKGRLSEMREAWLQWGKDHGYLPSNGT